MVYLVKCCNGCIWRSGENTEHTHCPVSPENGSAHVGRRKLGLQEFQEKEQGGMDMEAALGAVMQEVLSQHDFSAQEHGVRVGETSWIMRDLLAGLG